MKKLLVSFCLFLSLGAAAQSNVIKINPLSLIASTANLKYENILSDNISLQVGVYASFYQFETDDNEKYRYKPAFGIVPEFRFYVYGPGAPEGLFIAPYIDLTFLQVSHENPDQELNVRTLSSGVLAGYQFLFNDQVVLDLFAGVGYQNTNYDVDDPVDLPWFNGNQLVFRGGTSLGIFF